MEGPRDQGVESQVGAHGQHEDGLVLLARWVLGDSNVNFLFSAKLQEPCGCEGRAMLATGGGVWLTGIQVTKAGSQIQSLLS